MLEKLWLDLRYGLRTLRKQPAFAAVAIITLGLGIGVNTAIFSVVNAVLLAPLPYANVDQLALIWRTQLSTKTDQGPESVPNLNDLKEMNHSFEQVAATRIQQFVLTDGDQPERVQGLRVAATLFSLLQLTPMLGRAFLEKEDQPGSSPVVIISHNLWQQRYGADANVIGRQMRLDGSQFTIVGVLPAGIYYPTPETNVYVPLVLQPKEILRGAAFLRIIGRLKPDISLTKARADMDRVGARLAEQYPTENKGSGYNLVPLRDQVVGPVRPALLVLLAAVACVLLIACTNVANLLLARAAARKTEFAIRAALGATRGTLGRQMMI